MLTTEIKINGAPVGVLYLQRVATTTVSGEVIGLYDGTYHHISKPETTVIEGLLHIINDGYLTLVRKALDTVAEIQEFPDHFPNARKKVNP
jgi:hypothetical protein